MPSAKSRSLSYCCNVQDIPLLTCLVVVLKTKSMQRLKSNDEIRHLYRTPVWIGKISDSSVPQIICVKVHIKHLYDGGDLVVNAIMHENL